MRSIRTTPFHAPDAGGSAGANVRLHPLCSGEVLAPPALLDRRGPFAMARAIGIGLPKSDRIWIPAPVFLIEHERAGWVLVDTGLHPLAMHEPRRRMGVGASWLYEFRSAPEGDLHAQMRARGAEPSEVPLIIMTHLHTDHASAIPEFPHATFLLDQREWAAANKRPGFVNGYDSNHFAHPFDWRLVDFEGPDVCASAEFDRTVDVFGDRTVRLLATPGHTPGHLSVLVQCGESEVLLTGDAAYTRRTIGETVMPGIARNYREFRSSLRQIQRFVQSAPDAVVITGHDPDQWPTLEPVYS